MNLPNHTLKQIIFYLIITVALSSCESDPNLDNGNIKTTMLLIVVIIVVVCMLGVSYAKSKVDQTKASNKIYFDQAVKAIKEADIVSSNIIVRSPIFALAVSNNLQNIAVYSVHNKLFIFPKEKIISSECRYSYNEFVNSKTKAPIVSMVPQANTKGQIVKQFAFAELIISINDIQNPLLKFKFFTQEEAERYNALIKMVINNQLK